MTYIRKWRWVVEGCAEDCRKVTLLTDQHGEHFLHIGNGTNDFPSQLEERLAGMLDTTNVDPEIADATAEMHKQLQGLLEVWMRFNGEPYYDEASKKMGWKGDVKALQVIHARYHSLHPTLSRLYAVMDSYIRK